MALCTPAVKRNQPRALLLKGSHSGCSRTSSLARPPCSIWLGTHQKVHFSQETVSEVPFLWIGGHPVQVVSLFLFGWSLPQPGLGPQGSRQGSGGVPSQEVQRQGLRQVSQNQNPVQTWSTQSHASRIKADIRSYLWQEDCPLLTFI